MRSILWLVVLRFAYIIFIGILMATFVGVGIAAFYPEPRAPEYPNELKFTEPFTKEATESSQMIEQRIKYDKIQQDHMQAMKDYNRNVSIISLVGALILLTISLTILKSTYLIADGILLGGVLTLLYSIGRGFGSDDNKFRFVVVSIGLAISIFLGYIKFNNQNAKRI